MTTIKNLLKYVMTENVVELLSNRTHLERYSYYMDSSIGDKIEKIAPHLENLTDAPSSSFLSIGAGTGNFEHAIAELFPNAEVTALDASLPMIQTIQGQIDEHVKLGKKAHKHLRAVHGDATDLKFGDNTFDAVIASSVVHEIASYADNRQFGENVRKHFREVARVLKPGGLLIIRDFMQPENPEKILTLKVGKKSDEKDADPALFIEQFVTAFKGNDLQYVSEQLTSLSDTGGLSEGSKIQIRADHAFELLAHYSWSQSFEEEVREKYAYLPVNSYAEFIKSVFDEAGTESTVEKAETYLQQGYTDHISGRLDIVDEDHNTLPLPDFTGVVVIKKAA